MTTKLFPTILISLDVCAALVYLAHRDYRHTIYWLAAASFALGGYIGYHVGYDDGAAEVEAWYEDRRNLEGAKNAKTI